MTEIPLERAYAEACQALGESITRERLLVQEVQRLTQPPTSEPQPAAEPHP